MLDLLAKLAQTDRLISILAALLLSSDHHAGGSVPETNGTFRFVNVLSTWSA
jgi:hypothetical protein